MHLPFDRHYSSAGLSPGMGGGLKHKPIPHDHKPFAFAWVYGVSRKVGHPES